MLEQYKQIFELLSPYERRRGYMLLPLIFSLGLAEVLGVASLIPFMAVVANPETIRTDTRLSWAYDTLQFQAQQDFLVFLGGAVFCVLMCTLAFSAFTSWVTFRFTQMCNYRLSSRLLEAYLRRPYVWFLGQHSADLGKTILGEVSIVVGNAIMPALNVLSRGTLSILLLALVILVDPIVALTLAAVIGGLYLIIFLAVQRSLIKIGEDMYESNSERFKVAQEALGGIKDVKVSGLEATYLRRYHGPARRFTQRQATQLIISDIPRYLLEGVAFGGLLGIMLVLLIARPGGLGGVLPLMALYVFAGYRLLPALQQVYVNLSAMKSVGPFLTRLHRELTTDAHDPHQPLDDIDDGSPLPLRQHLTLEQATFHYPGREEPAMNAVTLKIAAGSTVGIVGPTGAGKTTLIDVLLGLLELDEGRMAVDGIEITARNRRRWQRTVGYVPQHIYLVDDTLAANIAFGDDPATIDMAAVERAARAAALHEFVRELPEGYATSVGERGVKLSGGQRQRIGIARALYGDPSVLVLDEATSALDNVTEKAVMEAVQHLDHSKTVIMIAHRLSTVRACDTIFVMNGGQLVDAGSYDDLAASSPVFQAMAKAAE